MKKIIELKNATVQVNNGFDEVKTILDHVNLDIYEHDFLTILGGNGAGKSTLFNVIAGTLMLTSGSVSGSQNGDGTPYDSCRKSPNC